MKKTLPISVVMPAFNVQSSLERAVFSIVNQTQLPLELIIVDDNSADDTWSMICNLSKQLPFLMIEGVRRDENKGPGSARNIGWNRAKGEYLAFLDADDAWHPRKLELQYAWMLRHPSLPLTGHSCVLISEEYFEPIKTDILSYKTRSFHLRDFLLSNRLSTPSVMLKTSLTSRFSEDLRYAEDYQLWLEIVSIHGRIEWVDMPLAYLFKAKYGASGLSAAMCKMEVGELIALTSLLKARRISLASWSLASLWSLVKFFRRIITISFMRIQK